MAPMAAGPAPQRKACARRLARRRSILDALYHEFRDPNFSAMPTLRRKVAAGHLGRKTKHGFYTY